MAARPTQGIKISGPASARGGNKGGLRVLIWTVVVGGAFYLGHLFGQGVLTQDDVMDQVKDLFTAASEPLADLKDRFF